MGEVYLAQDTLLERLVAGWTGYLPALKDYALME